LCRPKTNDVTLSLLKRARENGFSALVVTLDTQTIGWRPSDLQTSFNPFIHGVGCQIGFSDPTFMAKFNLQPIRGKHPEFPYQPAAMDKLIAGGDEGMKRKSFLGVEYLKEVVSGEFRSWQDVRFLRENWKGPLVLKGIQCAQVSIIFFHYMHDSGSKGYKSLPSIPLRGMEPGLSFLGVRQ
jgi:lactate 2-monooxygenase